MDVREQRHALGRDVALYSVGGMQVHRVRLPLAVALAVAAAGVATFALRPREGQIEPAEVEPRAYFSDDAAGPRARLPRPAAGSRV